MKYLKLYEHFVQSQVEIQDEIEISDKTIDDVLSDDFFDDMKKEDKQVTIDNKGVHHVKNWKAY